MPFKVFFLLFLALAAILFSVAELGNRAVGLGGDVI